MGIVTGPHSAPRDHGSAVGGSDGPHDHDHDPWAPPPAPAAERERRRYVRHGVLVMLPVAALTGLLLALLWVWRAPRVPLISNGETVFLANSEGQEAVGIDGTFLLLGLALGAAAGVAVFLWRRDGGIPLVLGLAVGSLLGSLLAWRLGVLLGPGRDIAARAREVGAGTVFDAPLELNAKPALLALPFAALAVHLVCTALWGPGGRLTRRE